ncbi:DUF393 domain-containing protein [Actinoplanes sp. LDG1-06]|uniref:DUF393 domain-containing protein n=1 Tax=Paractinoplanes ovalisporus TaxID=2810368 RepID=A0ABS2AC96_9ACTN|nr:DCC1-like thiol-disulfide oxidoreductase family protein [Actinoplanes ovalisporus]MBM2617447.1 DUF393 domain-containing protein [Actinoplanes ovalisporus]
MTTPSTGPAERGGGRALPAAPGGRRIERFTVLYDAGCPICRTARMWLQGRAQLVPLEFVPAGSDEARRRFPGLDHQATLRDVTVIGNEGSVYTGEGAWAACLWALADYRGLSERMGSGAAKRFIAAASAVRERTRTQVFDAVGTEVGYYGDGCDDRCR